MQAKEVCFFIMLYCVVKFMWSLLLDGYSPPPVVDIAESSSPITQQPQQQQNSKSDSMSNNGESGQYGTFDHDRSPLPTQKEQQPARSAAPVTSSGIDVDID